MTANEIILDTKFSQYGQIDEKKVSIRIMNKDKERHLEILINLIRFKKLTSCLRIFPYLIFWHVRSFFQREIIKLT